MPALTHAAARIGIAGTGFIGRSLASALEALPDLELSAVLTRRPSAEVAARAHVTGSIEDFLARCDLVVECTGDVLHATDVVDAALRAGKPVVTMDAELHVTTGSWFVGRGRLTESEGDQPGCLAALRERLLEMGFVPKVYGNLKGFLDPDPARAEMERWAARQGLSLRAVTSFTDGTKVQIEQALVANGLGAELLEPGMRGPRSDDLAAAGQDLAEAAARLGAPVSDYVLGPSLPRGVFIVAEHADHQREALRYLRFGDGPFYTLVQNYHLIHLEIPRTIRRVLEGGPVLLDNSARPRYGVAAVAKRSLRAGERIEHGIGGFEVRGWAVPIAAHPGHVPIGLLSRATVARDVEAGAILSRDDVELPDSLALRAWSEIRRRVLDAVAAG